MTSTSAPAMRNSATKPGRLLPLMVAGAVLAVFLMLTWWLGKSAQEAAIERVNARLEYEAVGTIQRIEQRMVRNEQLLRGVRGLFAASGDVNREQFRRYIEQHDLPRHLPGIQGIGYAQVVPASEKSAHIARVRSEGFPDYNIRPDTTRDLYAPIVFMEPFSGDNLKVFGFDPYSADVPRKAMDSARDLDAIISAKLRLQQDENRGDAPGFVMYLPVYRAGANPNDVNARRSEILGWIDAPFNMNRLVTAIERSRPSRIAYSIHDGSEISPSTLMYSSHGHGDPGGESANGLRFRQSMWIGGRNWTLLATPLPGDIAYNEYELPQLIARMGFVLSLLLAYVAWLLASGRQRALATAHAMTNDLRDSQSRLQAIIDNAAASIITIDDAGTIESMNFAALQCFGYEHDEILGRNISLLVPDSHRQHHGGYIRGYLESRNSGIIGKGREVNGLRKDGSVFPMFLVVSEMTIHGRRAFTGIVRDITLRKQAEAGLLARSEALARANSELIRFAEVSAHHLAEPIRRLGSYAQRLRLRLAQVPQCEADDEIRISIDTLEKEAARLRILVRDIERYIASGLPSGHASMVDVGQLLQSLQLQLAPRLQAVSARLDLAGHLPPVHVDRRQLNMLFTVLVENALQHGRPTDAGVVLTVRIHGERDGKLSRYRIEDNGSGIPAQYHERVFNIFERLGTDPGSTGIGLAIARRIVESCRGRIWIDGAASGGTMVVFEIPDGPD